MKSLWCHQYDGATLTFSFNKTSVSFILPTYPSPLYLSPSYKTSEHSTPVLTATSTTHMYFITSLTEPEQCLQRSFPPIQRVTSFHFFCSSSLCSHTVMHTTVIFTLSHAVIHTLSHTELCYMQYNTHIIYLWDFSVLCWKLKSFPLLVNSGMYLHVCTWLCTWCTQWNLRLTIYIDQGTLYNMYSTPWDSL